MTVQVKHESWIKHIEENIKVHIEFFDGWHGEGFYSVGLNVYYYGEHNLKFSSILPLEYIHFLNREFDNHEDAEAWFFKAYEDWEIDE